MMILQSLSVMMGNRQMPEICSFQMHSLWFLVNSVEGSTQPNCHIQRRLQPRLFGSGEGCESFPTSGSLRMLPCQFAQGLIAFKRQQSWNAYYPISLTGEEILAISKFLHRENVFLSIFSRPLGNSTSTKRTQCRSANGEIISTDGSNLKCVTVKGTAPTPWYTKNCARPLSPSDGSVIVSDSRFRLVRGRKWRSLSFHRSLSL